MVAVRSAYKAAMRELPTKDLTRASSRRLPSTSPAGSRPAHQAALRAPGRAQPAIVVIHGNQTQHVPAAYRRFLEGHFREVFRLKGTPMRIEFRTDVNPFAGRRNVLTAGR